MKILVFVDGSEHSFKAVETASKIAKETQASVTLLAIALRYSDSESVKSYDKSLEKESKIHLEKAENLMKEKGINPKILLMKDVTLLNVVDVIVDVIEDIGFDLAIIGSQKLTGLKKLIFGGVHTRLIDYAPCSVLVVKTQKK